jgi:hypothetical protein
MIEAHERSHHRYNHNRLSPRNGFNGFLRALPGDRALLPPSSALLIADLTPASGRQNHTTSPSASAPFVCVPPTSTASRPASVTIASRPSVGRDGDDIDLIWVSGEAEYFCKRDWTAKSLICPSGKSMPERGTFSATFYLACLAAIELEGVALEGDLAALDFLPALNRKKMVVSSAAAEIKTKTANSTKDQSMLWGSPIEFWALWGVRLLFGGAIIGVGGLVLSAISAYVLYRVADVAQRELAVETRVSSERIAGLNNDTARLIADNLALQTVLLPRHVGLFGIDEEPRAKTWFAGFDRWAGTKILIQVVPGDPEAQNLANEIAIVLSKFGWRPEFIDEKRSGVSLNLSEGLNVYSPASYKSWDAKNTEHQAFSNLNNAKLALASALTQAGLGIGEYPVPNAILVVDFPAGSDAASSQYGKFNPSLDGVYLQVGSRPVAATVAWIKRGRPDRAGNKPAEATATEQHK